MLVPTETNGRGRRASTSRLVAETNCRGLRPSTSRAGNQPPGTPGPIPPPHQAPPGTPLITHDAKTSTRRTPSPNQTNPETSSTGRSSLPCRCRAYSSAHAHSPDSLPGRRVKWSSSSSRLLPLLGWWCPVVGAHGQRCHFAKNQTAPRSHSTTMGPFII